MTLYDRDLGWSEASELAIIAWPNTLTSQQESRLMRGQTRAWLSERIETRKMYLSEDDSLETLTYIHRVREHTLAVNLPETGCLLSALLMRQLGFPGT